MDLKRKHGWKKDETAMRYINDSKEHPRKMSKLLSGASSSQPQIFSAPQVIPTIPLSKPNNPPKLMPFPIPESVKVKLQKGDTDRDMPYINLAGATNVTITFN